MRRAIRHGPHVQAVVAHGQAGEAVFVGFRPAILHARRSGHIPPNRLRQSVDEKSVWA